MIGLYRLKKRPPVAQVFARESKTSGIPQGSGLSWTKSARPFQHSPEADPRGTRAGSLRGRLPNVGFAHGISMLRMSG
jgi:hypothetical protein